MSAVEFGAWTVRCGDIGDDQHEIELEPIEEPVRVPEPIRVPEPDKVPA